MFSKSIFRLLILHVLHLFSMNNPHITQSTTNLFTKTISRFVASRFSYCNNVFECSIFNTNQINLFLGHLQITNSSSQASRYLSFSPTQSLNSSSNLLNYLFLGFFQVGFVSNEKMLPEKGFDARRRRRRGRGRR